MNLNNEELEKTLKAIKEQKPLIHHITNYVVANETANLTLNFGALPVMAQSIDEVEEMVKMAGCLLLNIGTLDKNLIDSMIAAGKVANNNSIPIVLDPVGVGATDFRTKSAQKILDNIKIDVIRGNCAEIATLAGLSAEIKGVESISTNDISLEASKKLSEKTNAVVVVTGPEDVIYYDNQQIMVKNGDPMMGTVTGTGCMATTAIACFCAVSDNYLNASAAALSVYGIAGENAAKDNQNKPGSFHTALYDAVSNLSKDDFKKIRIS